MVHGNIHHNVPQSRRGSDDEGNLTNPRIPDHATYHWITQNMLPTEAAQFLSVQSITHPNPRKRMDARQVHDVLSIGRGQELYWDKAFIPGNHPDLPTRMTQDLYHTTRIMRLQRQQLATTIDFINGKIDELPPDHHFMATEGAKFFEVRTAAEVIEGILSEKRDQELLWCKPLKFVPRNQLLHAVTHQEATPTGHRREYLWALQEHQDVLDGRLRTIGTMAMKLHEQLEWLVKMGHWGKEGANVA